MSQMTMSKTRRFIVLDSFRGLCALCVVLFHLHVPYSLIEWTFFRNSHLFVEFFFVLSGFVLFHTYNKLSRFDDFKQFIVKRIFRLYPLHVFMLAIFILFEFGKAFAEIKGFNFNGHAFSGSNSPHEIIPNLLLLQSWLNNADALSFNGPSWSISAEMYVYVLFALIIVLSRKFSIYVFAAITAFACFNLMTESDLFKMTALRVGLCFFLGTLTYRVYKKIEHYRFKKNTLTLLEGVVLLGVFIILSTNIKYQGVIASIWFSIVIVIFSFEGGLISSFLKNKYFMVLGKLSYSIYMVHFGVIFLLISLALVVSRLTAGNFAPMLKEPYSGEVIRYVSTGSPLANNLLVLLVLAVIVVLAHFSWKYVELRGIVLGQKILSFNNNVKVSSCELSN